MSQPIAHPTGHYRFLPGIAPYSCGVIAQAGFQIVRVTLQESLPWRTGFAVIDGWLAQQQLPRTQLCAVELRSPAPFSMQGFIDFNRDYCAILEQWGVYVAGQNPIARTNVCPTELSADEPHLHAFSVVQPQAVSPSVVRPTFIVAGAGELRDGLLEADRIIARGDTSPSAIASKATYVVQVMQQRLAGLGATWADVTAVDAYTVHSLAPVYENLLLAELPALHRTGLTWQWARPPVVDIEFEMDLRGVALEYAI
jgi:hypothetical protein